ncbi:MAG: class I SAM-dependent methyltransferase [Chloroflexi bacterium]|nr:class I SAM-dependent methyltransferase [Chloroflexota bacterium]
MQIPPDFNPTIAWEENQRDMAQRLQPQEIADFICNRAFWSQSQEFYRQLRDRARLKPGDHLLDAGCGTGQLGFAAAVYGRCRITMMDYSLSALTFAQAVAEELHRRGKQFEAFFVRDSLEDIALQESFDIVTNEGVLEHWFSKEKRLHVLKEMVKVAKPGGTVILWVPNIHNPLYRNWIQRTVGVPEQAFSVQELRTLMVSAGLEQVAVFPTRGYFSFIRYLSAPKWLGGILWLLEVSVLKHLSLYMLHCGYELVGVGRKRQDVVRNDDRACNAVRSH